MPWWFWWLVIGLPLAVVFVTVMVKALEEMNPDPGWRAREAEIRRLEQEKRLRELRSELGDGGV